MFLTKKYRKCVCINCIPVSWELQIILSRQEESIIDRLRRDVKACESESESIVKSIENKLSKTKSKLRKSNLRDYNDAKFSNLEKKSYVCRR